MDLSQPSCRSFTLCEIQKATKNFDQSLTIGTGGFGKVYRASITYGANPVDAAIKRCTDPESIESKEFWAEVQMLSELHHPNIVSLIGYCDNEREKILVYEYMPNGTLDDHLHKHRTPLSWVQRLKICINAANGLSYLHCGARVNSGVIHGDLRSSNILLDQNWVAKISDFGLSSLKRNGPSTIYDNTCVIHNFGYLDPVYFETGKLRRASDVYSFGVLLFEILCGKPVVGEEPYGEGMNLVTWAQVSIRKGNLKHITDPDIRDEVPPKYLKKFINVAKRCSDKDLDPRPTMAEVVANLESALASQLKFYGSQKGRLKSLLSQSSCRSFTLRDIVEATQNFNESLVIGTGDFGRVYRGFIRCGANPVVAAIKRCTDPKLIESKEFWAEVQMLSELRHPNIVSLLGYCDNEKEKILVYEYMPNGTLDDHLHKHRTPLSWVQRLKICINAASGLSYLHCGARVKSGVIHGDLRSSNILLDENWVAKISDFGLSSLKRNGPSTIYDNTCVIHNFGYLDPVYFETGKLRRASDVYSFGVLLFEILCGKPVVGEEPYGEGMNLVTWAQVFIRKGNLKHITDPDIRDEIPPKYLKKFISVAKRCSDKDLEPRPTMAEVVANLESVLASQQKFNGSQKGRLKSFLTAQAFKLSCGYDFLDVF